jgi:hypothetical protein
MTASARRPASLGTRLKEALDAAGLSFPDAARLLRVDANTVAIWAAGLEPPPPARPAVEALIADLKAGRRPRQHVARLFARVEQTRGHAVTVDRLTHERGRLSRLLFRHIDVIAEQSCKAHETFKLAIASTTPARVESLAADVDDTYAQIIENLTVMLDVAQHLREQSRDAVSARQDVRGWRAA